MHTQKLVPNQDYTIDENGMLVFTREFHLKRGYCCQSGCRHCPYQDQSDVNEHDSARSDPSTRLDD